MTNDIWYFTRDVRTKAVLQNNSSFCREILLGSIRDFLYNRATQHNTELSVGYRASTMRSKKEQLSNVQNTFNKLFDTHITTSNNRNEIQDNQLTSNYKNGLFFTFMSSSPTDFITLAQISSMLLFIKLPSIRFTVLDNDFTSFDIDSILYKIVSNYKDFNNFYTQQFISTLLYIKFIDKKDPTEYLKRNYFNGTHSYMMNLVANSTSNDITVWYKYLYNLLCNLPSDIRIQHRYVLVNYFRNRALNDCVAAELPITE